MTPTPERAATRPAPGQAAQTGEHAAACLPVRNPATGVPPGPPAAGPDLPRTWTIELPPSTVLLTSNHRLHRMAANSVTQSLKDLAMQLARTQRIPHLERADILITYLPPPRLRKLRHPLASERVEDPDALAPTGKALIDGLTQAGVFVSDNRKHVRRVTYELLPGSCPRGQVLLRITEVTP